MAHDLGLGTQVRRWYCYRSWFLRPFRAPEARPSFKLPGDRPKDTCPKDTCPKDTCPEDTCPEDTCPEDTSRKNTCPKDTSRKIVGHLIAVAAPETVL